MRRWLVPIVLLAACAPLNALPPATRPAGAESELAAIDAEIDAIALPATSGPADYAAHMREESARRARLIDRIDGWLAAHRRHAARERLLMVRLEQRFLAETAAGRPLDALQRELDSIRPRASPALQAEVDYWRLRLDQAEERRAALTSRPSGDAHATRMRAYLRRHPASPRAADLFDEWMEQCHAAGDFAEAGRALDELKKHFPERAVTRMRSARDRLLRARGETWKPTILLTTGLPFDWTRAAGRPVVVAFWASWDAASCRALEQLRREVADVATVVAVSLDASPDAARRALRTVAAEWPLACDGQGWSGSLVQTWGIHRLPTFLLVDADGRMAGAVSRVDELTALLARGRSAP